MEMRTTFKHTKVELHSYKADYKSRHFHDFSIITTEHDLNEDYAIHMITHYYGEQQDNNPELPLYKERSITFMINKHYQKMKTLKRQGCTQQDIKRTYDNFLEGPPGHQQVQR
eukprot:4988007-Amphidinium_carterae.2